MAEIGLLHPVFAPIATETPNSAITYSAGSVIAKAVSADLSWKRANSIFYADDAEAEIDNGVTGGTLKFGVDHLTLANESIMTGTQKETVSTVDEYSETGAIAPAGGFGYIRVLKKAGVISYRAFWVHKTRLGITGESAKTKGENITWENPTVEGDIIGVFIDSSGTPKFRVKADFSTLAAAITWLHAKANISG